jgi:hypothetical protein
MWASHGTTYSTVVSQQYLEHYVSAIINVLYSTVYVYRGTLQCSKLSGARCEIQQDGLGRWEARIIDRVARHGPAQACTVPCTLKSTGEPVQRWNLGDTNRSKAQWNVTTQKKKINHRGQRLHGLLSDFFFALYGVHRTHETFTKKFVSKYMHLTMQMAMAISVRPG